MFAIKKNHVYLTLVVLLALNLYVWQLVAMSEELAAPLVYFLDVGQGDSQLILWPSPGGGMVKVLIDGGRNKAVLSELDKVLGKTNDKYIDLVIATHDDIDHSGGLAEVIRRYQIGAFIFNGRSSESVVFVDTVQELKRMGKEMLALAMGDKISYRDNRLLVLSPDSSGFYKDDNEASLVLRLESSGGTALFTGDIGFKTESGLLKRFTTSQVGNLLAADVLKVSHHGSKYSSDGDFLAAVKPRVSVIGVGKNSYGHPTAAVLDRLAAVGANVYRTDRDGTVKIILDKNKKLALTASVSQFGNLLEVRLSAVPYQQPNAGQLNFAGSQKSVKKPKPPAPLVVIKISAAQAGSDKGTKDEFVKLTNPNNFVVNLAGWSLKKKTASGKEYGLVAGNKFQGNINVGGQFIIAHQEYQGVEKVDQLYSNKSNSIAKGNTVLLYDAEDRLIDQIIVL